MKISVSDEPNLNMAEDAFGSQRWSEAVDGYMKALHSTTKQWVRDYASFRLQIAAAKSHRFDAAVESWLATVERDPKSAAAHTPALPTDSNSTYLKTAVTQLETAAAADKDDAEKVTTIRSFQLQIAKALHDDQLTSDLATQLTSQMAQHPTNSTSSNDVRAIVEAQLGLARVAIDQKDFATAEKKLQQVKGSVVEPADQADWLWYEAEVKAGQAGDAKDTTARNEAELAYMRLVANFPNYAQSSQALYNTAQLMEQGGDNPGAINVYQQVAREYPKQPIAQQASAAAQRLQSDTK